LLLITTSSLVLSHDVTQSCLAYHREEYLFNDPFRVRDGRLSQLGEQRILAFHPPDLCEELLGDLLLSASTNVMHDLQEQFDQVVGDLLLTQAAIGGNQCVSNRFRVATQLVEFLGSGTLAITSYHFGSQVREQIRR